MARIVCQVLQRAERITFLWSEGAASFEPYHLEGAERANLLQIAGQIHAKLAGDGAGLAELGHQLYRAIFRRDASEYAAAEAVQAWLEKLITSNSIEKLEFLSDVPGLIPWNLVTEGPDAGFWGARFNLGAGRRVNALRQNPTQVNPSQLVVADPALVEQLPEVQQLFLKPGDRGKLAHTIAALADALKQDAPDLFLLLVRFEKGLLRLGDDSFRIADLQKWLAIPKEGNPDPLVILMACGDAAEQSAYPALLGDATDAFSGLVANEALLSATKAFAVGHSLAQRFAEGKQNLGEILRTLRQEQGAPALAFSAFCPPQLCVAAEAAADAPVAELAVENVPLPELPYRPFAAFEEEDRALFFGREDDVVRGALATDAADTLAVLLHGAPAVGKTSYLQAGLLPYLEQECIGYRALRDREPLETPAAEKDYPILILRCTNDLAGQFADALTAFCAQPFVYTTPAGTQATVDLPRILRETVAGVAPASASTAIQSAPAASSITATPGDGDEDDGPADGIAARDLWIALRDHKDLLARLLDALTRPLPFELVIVVDQGEELLTLVTTAQQQVRRQKALDMLTQLWQIGPRCKIVYTIRSQALGPFVSLFPDGRAPAGWRPFALRPLSETEMTDALLYPTTREDIPYCDETPFPKYGFAFEDGLAPQLVAEAIEASATELQGPLPMLQAIGALLYDTQVVGKKQNTLHALDVKDLGGVKQALGKYLDRTLENLPATKQARQALRDLIAKLYTGHADGTLSRDLVAQGELKSYWNCPTEPVEPAVDLAAQEQGLFEIQPLLIGGQADLFVSLPQDSLAQLGRNIGVEREKQAAARAKVLDMLWIMIPLMFLAAAVTFWGTRRYSAGEGPDELMEKIKPQVIEMLKEERKKTMTDVLPKVQRAFYLGQLTQADQALRAGDSALARLRLITRLADRRDFKLPELRGFEWKYLWRQINCERFALEGRLGPVYAVAISPDGQWAACAGKEGNTRIASLATGKLAASIAGAGSAIKAIAFSPDGNMLAAAGADKIVRLYGIQNPKADVLEVAGEPKTLPGHDGEVRALAFSKDSKILASGGADKTVIVWDVAAGKEKHKLKGHAAAVLALAFAPDGKTLISAGDEADFIVWDASAGKKVNAGKTAYASIAALAVTPDGKLCTGGTEAAPAADFGMIRFWNLPDGKETLVPIQHSSGVTALALAPDGKTVVSAGTDHVIRVWNIETRTQQQHYLGHADTIDSLAFGKDAILSGSADATAKVWDPAHSSGPDVIKGHSDWVQAVALNKKDTLLASGSRDGAVKLWDPKTGRPAKLVDAKTGQPLTDLPIHKGAVTALKFSSHADKEPFYLAVATRDDKNEGEIKIWQFDSGAKEGWKVKEHRTLAGHKKGVTCLEFHPDPKKADLLVSGSADHTVKLWDAKSGEEKASFGGHKDEVRCVAFSFEERAVFSADKDGLICYNELATKEIRKFTHVHNGPIESIAVFPRALTEEEHGETHNAILTGGADLAMRLWDYDQSNRSPDAKAEKLHEYRSHTQTLSSVLYHELNGGMFASASWDGTIKLYDPIGERFTLSGHQGAVRAIAMAADQSFLVSAGNDKTIRIWRTQAERPAVK